MKKRVLVYLDILGFEKRAKKDAGKISLESSEKRKAYKERIEHRLNKLKISKTTQGYPRKECSVVSFFKEVTTDSWLLFTDDVWNAFKCIGEVLRAELPMEIVIGIKEFDESQSREDLVALTDATIAYLKSDILTSYKRRRGKKIEQTFVLLTKEAYESIDSPNISHIKLCKSLKGEQFYPIEKEQLKKILTSLEFLEKLGSKRPEYREIEALYVKPKSYDKITNTLKTHNIVFLIGDAEMGKTYTAIKLLFDYYRDGYEPIYFREEDRESQWTFIRERQGLAGKAIYLEDPWDKVEFNATGSIFKEIGSLIREVGRCDCKIILSSREKVFREFVKRKETMQDLWSYACMLTLGSGYSKQGLVHMLTKYVCVFNPIWSKNESLKRNAFEFAEQNLNTPMSIRQFVQNTADVINKKTLLEEGKKAAEETRISFAREIEEMFRKRSYDRIVFLSFPFIQGIGVEIAKSCYLAVLEDMKVLGYDLIGAKDFDALIEECVHAAEIDTKSGWIRYIHPMYQDAFGSTLIYDGNPSDICEKIFCKVLAKFCEGEEVPWWIPFSIVNYFDKLPEKVRTSLLVSLSKKGHEGGVANAITMNFKKASDNERNLLVNISKKEKAAEQIALLTTYNLDELPSALRNKLLVHFAEGDEATEVLARGIRGNFDGLPAQIRNRLLLELIKKDRVASILAVVVLEFFEQLPAYVRNKLLLKLSSKAKAARNVARAVADYFDLLPHELRNELLLKLSEKKEAVQPVARTIANHFNELPQEIRNLLDSLQPPLELEIERCAQHSLLQAIEIISNVRSKIDPCFALRTLEKIGRSQNQEIRIAAKSLIDSIQTDLEENEECRE